MGGATSLGFTKVKVCTNLRLGEASLARLQACYTLAGHSNAGIERPHEEVAVEHAQEALETAGAVISEVERAVKDP